MKVYSFLKWLCSASLAALWTWIEPTIPMAAVCVFAVVLDCISAFRLNRRIKCKYPESGADGKFKSQHASKILTDLGMVFLCIVLAYRIETDLLPIGSLYLANWVASIFCFVEFWSILENESSCNGASWAKFLQKFLVDKTERHINITHEELIAIIKNKQEEKEDEHSSNENCQ